MEALVPAYMQGLVPPFMEDLADVPLSQGILTNRPLTVRFPWEFVTNRTNRQKKNYTVAK